MSVSMTAQDVIQIVIAVFGLVITLIPTIIAIKQYTKRERSNQDNANQKRKGEKRNCFNASVRRGRFIAHISWVSEDKKEEG